MNTPHHPGDLAQGGNGFLLGLLAGTVVGAGLALLFAPRAAMELRQRVSGTAKDFADRTADRYAEVSASVGKAAEDATGAANAVRNAAADAVAHGAQAVEQFAKSAKTR